MLAVLSIKDLEEYINLSRFIFIVHALESRDFYELPVLAAHLPGSGLPSTGADAVMPYPHLAKSSAQRYPCPPTGLGPTFRAGKRGLHMLRRKFLNVIPSWALRSKSWPQTLVMRGGNILRGQLWPSLASVILTSLGSYNLWPYLLGLVPTSMAMDFLSSINPHHHLGKVSTTPPCIRANPF